jgi:thiol-disulfide isomerase/thioredoxin
MERLRWAGLGMFFMATVCPAAMPPHLDPAGQDAYRQYQGAEGHRAFAVSPGGRWGWSSGAANPDLAGEQALAYCQDRNEQRCVLHGVDGETVFDAKAWAGLWGPYADAATAARAQVGLKRGMRFPDLMLTDAQGRALKLSDMNGEVRVLHFWGSWCGACRKEMPEMQDVARQLGKSVRFILVQVREGIADSRVWLKRQSINLPAYDSGARASDSGELRLAGGGKLNDREIAKAFPTTYVLDRHGVVLFSRTGPIHGWSEYVVLLQHAVRGGK